MKNNFIDFMLKNKIFIRGGWGNKFNKSVSITLSDIKTTNILIKYLKKFDTNNS
jgi:phage antirepressor YoqD-like protein